MKVNIKGRGVVPRVNQLAPVYNIDLGKNDIQFLLNFNNLKVYETKTGLLIRHDTIDEMFAKSQPSPIKKEEPILVGIDLAKVEIDEPEVEQTDLDVDSLIPDEALSIDEEEVSGDDINENEQEDVIDVEPVDETTDELEDVIDDAEDTIVEETSSNQSYPSKKIKNKKKNRS